MLYEIPGAPQIAVSGRMPNALITVLAAFSGLLTETKSEARALPSSRSAGAWRLCATLRATVLRGPTAAPGGLRLEATLRAHTVPLADP